MEIQIRKYETLCPCGKPGCRESDWYYTLATEETLPFLRQYSDAPMRVGDTVRIRDEHLGCRGTVIKFKPEVVAAMRERSAG